MKLLSDVKDSKADALLSLLNKMGNDVKVKTISPDHARFLGELKEAVDEHNLIKAGKKQARGAHEFLNEL